VILALGWALIHTSYSATVIAVIFFEGLLLGMARWRKGSVLAPALMHILWNLYAVW
jgi:membrane protease YdiL (CAAX protease family)